MPIRFTRGPDSQYAKTPVDVPVHLLDESLGTVRLILREPPAGWVRELEDNPNQTPDEVLRQWARWGVAGHRAEDFLEEGEAGEKPIPYTGSTATYHNATFAVASEDTLDLYERVLPKKMFLHSIRAAIAFYIGGVVPTPRQIWDSAKPKEKAPPLPSAPNESPETLVTTSL
jgi:hypothetical protein